MKKIITILLAIIMMGTIIGCKADIRTEEAVEVLASSAVPASAALPTATPEPTLAPTPISAIFHRIDNNPAEYAVIQGDPFSGETDESAGDGSGNRVITITDYLYVTYLVKDRLEKTGVVPTIEGVNVYEFSDPGGSGIYVKKNIDANHIFQSKYIENESMLFYISRMNKTNGKIHFSLLNLVDVYENINTKKNLVTNIARFLEVSNNKIYYLNTDGNVYAFEMTTQEIETVEGYEVIDYTTLPEGIDDYTAEYVLTYDNENKRIDITHISIDNGAFVVGDLYQTVDCSELEGKIVDIKAGYDALFIATKQGKTNTIYRYDMYDKIYETLYQTEYQFDCSYVTEEDYFAAFYDGNYHIQAIKYNFEEASNRLIYDGDTCAYWEHVSPKEDTVDEVVKHPRYKDINYMTYKGHMLFGFNIDKDGVTTLVFKSDVIDRDKLPRPKAE